MRFLFSLILLSILIFSLSCKTTTQDQSSLSSSSLIQPEESQEKPQSIVIPVSSLGDVSETRQQILQNSLEDELKEHFTLISQERFEEAQEKAFEQLEYEECTEDQCIMLIQEMLQVENVFHLQVIGEGSNTQLSLSWRTLDENKKETDSCIDCGSFELDKMIGGLVGELVGIQTEIVTQIDSGGTERQIEKKIILIDNPNRGGGECETVCEGLVGFYPFNGNANDMSGNGNHGEVYGAQLTYNHKGVKDSAYLFDGEASFIEIPNKIKGSSYSITVHAKVDQFVQYYDKGCEDHNGGSNLAGLISNNVANGIFLANCLNWINPIWDKHYQLWFVVNGDTFADMKLEIDSRVEYDKYYLFTVTVNSDQDIISLYQDKKN